MNHRERRGAQRGVGERMDEKALAIQLPRRTREILEAAARAGDVAGAVGSRAGNQ